MDGAAAHYANLICAGDNVIISPLVCAKGLIGLRRKCYVEKKHSDNMKNNVQLEEIANKLGISENRLKTWIEKGKNHKPWAKF